jgi:DNA-directed RNA polymerase alpha subunit
MSLLLYSLFPVGPSVDPTDRNTVVFRIDHICERNPKAPKGSMNPNELYIDHELRSSDIIWVPQGEQEEVFASKAPAPTNLNIVLAKLRPGQEVNMELHAVKGVGKDHAKFSPVGAFMGPRGHILSNSRGFSIFLSYCVISTTPTRRNH